MTSEICHLCSASSQSTVQLNPSMNMWKDNATVFDIQSNKMLILSITVGQFSKASDMFGLRSFSTLWKIRAETCLDWRLTVASVQSPSFLFDCLFLSGTLAHSFVFYNSFWFPLSSLLLFHFIDSMNVSFPWNLSRPLFIRHRGVSALKIWSRLMLM